MLSRGRGDPPVRARRRQGFSRISPTGFRELLREIDRHTGAQPQLPARPEFALPH